MKDDSQTRSYRQTARAKAAEETGRRIVAAFVARMEAGWFDEIRLDDVARDAGVTVQTVIRRFGSKEGLLDASRKTMHEEILDWRAHPVGDVGRAIDIIIEEYEQRGDLVMRMLAQEDRFEAVRTMTEQGRMTHREWVGQVFAPWLDRLEGENLRDVHDRLVIALDIYVWKLLRLDMKRGKSAVRAAMLSMAANALSLTPDALARNLAVPSEM